MEALFAKSERRQFNDAEYVLSVSGDTESLSVEVEHAEDGRRWRSRFAANFVEEITRRTGNAKKFDVFVRMLLSALAQESDCVYLDVLTARDLEMLRRHANPQGPPTTNPTTAQSDKRYMILTYRAEFDKVHYPLPLPLDERSEEDVLRAMVGRLKSELSQARETIEQARAPPPPPDNELHTLQRQNRQLSDGLQAMQKEAEQLRAELRLRVGGPGQQNHVRDDEVLRLRNELTRTKAEVKSLKDELKQRELAQKRAREKEAAELRAERQKAERLQAQLKKLEEEKRGFGARRGPSAEMRRPSAERTPPIRSRPASRTPSAERARPPSRPPSRPASRPPPRPSSRASSVASSRERTPSPSSFLARGRQAPPPRQEPPRRAALNRSGSPGRDRSCSPGSTMSPYRRPARPGSNSRERTPSPQRGPPQRKAPPAAPALSLRERGASTTSPKPPSTRYGGVTAPAAPQAPEAAHQPGSLFGLAANLGLGAGAAGGAGSGAGASAAGDEACDIDARLQALQSFLKQTKNIAA
ncbi:unnamed protein product [Effrenium voratum]|uniref:Coiled-coil domain-containing protein 61 n=1 Tax=Effrenium voratum TaxID=2562239 RepID=A0AA36I7Z3_9DINO|nr:unnamed protein product [Effrenium voratum]